MAKLLETEVYSLLPTPRFSFSLNPLPMGQQKCFYQAIKNSTSLKSVVNTQSPSVSSIWQRWAFLLQRLPILGFPNTVLLSLPREPLFLSALLCWFLFSSEPPNTEFHLNSVLETLIKESWDTQLNSCDILDKFTSISESLTSSTEWCGRRA